MEDVFPMEMHPLFLCWSLLLIPVENMVYRSPFVRFIEKRGCIVLSVIRVFYMFVYDLPDVAYLFVGKVFQMHPETVGLSV